MPSVLGMMQSAREIALDFNFDKPCFIAMQFVVVVELAFDSVKSGKFGQQVNSDTHLQTV